MILIDWLASLYLARSCVRDCHMLAPPLSVVRGTQDTHEGMKQPHTGHTHAFTPVQRSLRTPHMLISQNVKQKSISRYSRTRVYLYLPNFYLLTYIRGSWRTVAVDGSYSTVQPVLGSRSDTCDHPARLQMSNATRNAVGSPPRFAAWHVELVLYTTE